MTTAKVLYMPVRPRRYQHSTPYGDIYGRIYGWQPRPNPSTSAAAAVSPRPTQHPVQHDIIQLSQSVPSRDLTLSECQSFTSTGPALGASPSPRSPETSVSHAHQESATSPSESSAAQHTFVIRNTGDYAKKTNESKSEYVRRRKGSINAIQASLPTLASSTDIAKALENGITHDDVKKKANGITLKSSTKG